MATRVQARAFEKIGEAGEWMIGKLLAVAAVGLLSANAEGTVRVEKTEYKGWPNCYRVSNGEVELIVTGDVGPRVIWSSPGNT